MSIFLFRETDWNNIRIYIMNKSNKRILLILLVTSLTLLSITSCKRTDGEKRGPTPKAEPPNIILITVDTLRADHLYGYGNNKIYTPNIDKLIKEGALFTRAKSQTPSTFPSHASLLTSAYPRTHGIRANGSYKINFDRIKYLNKILKEKGYKTAGIVSMDALITNIANYEDFDFHDDMRGTATNVRWERRSNETNEIVLNWLMQNYTSKFFLWIHYFDPHTPYKPLAPYDKIYQPSDPNQRWNYNIPKEKIKKLLRLDNNTNPDYYISQYNGEITFNDKSIGEVIKFLKEKKIYDNTFIILTADHGESFGEHEEIYFAHTWRLYTPFIHVPLIFKFPKAYEPAKKIITNITEGVDVAPTILSYLNIKIPPEFEGKSLFTLINGKSTSSKEYLFAENAITKWKIQDKIFSIQDKNWQLLYAKNFEKYSFQRTDKELYDLKSDPLQKKNLIGSYPDIEKQLFEALNKWLKEDKAFLREPIPNVFTIPKLAKETEERLKSLGYLGGKEFKKLAPPILENPENGAILKNPPQFKWQSPKGGQSYKVFIIGTKKHGIVKTVKNHKELTAFMGKRWKDLPQGSYKWHVLPFDRHNKEGRKSETFVFTKITEISKQIGDSKHFECEDSVHNTGFAVNDPKASNKKAQYCEAELNPPQYMVFGQRANLKKQKYKAIFALKGTNCPENENAAYIDVASDYGRKIFASLNIIGSKINSKNYKEFELEFTGTKDQKFEFRIWYYGMGKIYADYIDLVAE